MILYYYTIYSAFYIYIMEHLNFLAGAAAGDCLAREIAAGLEIVDKAAVPLDSSFPSSGTIAVGPPVTESDGTTFVIKLAPLFTPFSLGGTGSVDGCTSCCDMPISLYVEKAPT